MLDENQHLRAGGGPQGDRDPRRWWALTLLCAAFFLVVSDSTIVYTALPSIEEGVGFSPGRVHWVIIAYALTTGGFLLLGGRAADLLGRRRVFLAGVGTFTGASLLCGLAWSGGVLIGARVVEGLGAAFMVPAALSILMAIFPDGADRNRALGVWGALGGIGATAGLLLGGPLTDVLGWRWIFLVNVPVGLAVLALGSRALPGTGRHRRPGRFDAGGAVTITLALLALVYALVEAPGAGWTSARSIALFAVAIALAGSFVLIEMRTPAPLVPLRLFRSPTLVGGNLVILTAGMAVDGLLFTFTLFAQQVLGYSAVQFALAMAVMTATSFVGVIAGQRLVTRAGPRGTAVCGMSLVGIGSLLLIEVTADAPVSVVVLVGLMVFGAGLGAAFVAGQIAALSCVADDDGGVASGIEETTFALGSAFGVAALATIASTQPGAAAGARAAFGGAAVVAALGLGAAWILLRTRRTTPDDPTAS